MSNEHLSNDNLQDEEEDAFTLFRHFRHNAIINEEDEDLEDEVFNQKDNSKRCEDPTRISTTATSNTKLSPTSSKEYTLNSQPETGNRRLAFQPNSHEREREETSLDVQSKTESLEFSVNKLATDASRPGRVGAFIKHRELRGENSESKYDITVENSLLNLKRNETTECDGVRFPRIPQAHCVTVEKQNKLTQTPPNSFVESINNEFGKYNDRKQYVQFKLRQNSFPLTKQNKFLLGNSADDITVLHCEAERLQREQRENLQQLKWDIYESNIQKQAVKVVSKVLINNSHSYNSAGKHIRVPVATNNCDGRRVLSTRLRKRAKSYPSQQYRFKKPSNFLQLIHEQNENIERFSSPTSERKSFSVTGELETRASSPSVDAPRLTKSGLEIVKTKVTGDTKTNHLDSVASDKNIKSKVKKMSRVDHEREENQTIQHSLEETINNDEVKEKKENFELGPLSATRRVHQHTKSEQATVQSDSAPVSQIPTLLYKTKSESDQIEDKIRRFFEKPLPQTPFTSLRVKTKNTEIASEKCFGKNQPEVLPAVKREKTREIVNLQTCPNLNVFTDLSWLYRDKKNQKCRYLREISSPTPPVEDVFKD